MKNIPPVDLDLYEEEGEEEERDLNCQGLAFLPHSDLFSQVDMDPKQNNHSSLSENGEWKSMVGKR